MSKRMKRDKKKAKQIIVSKELNAKKINQTLYISCDFLSFAIL